MPLRICTWNVNSVRLRAEQAARFVAEQRPDVLCMQEIKCREGEFPRQAFIDMGLPHLKIAGQKGWHGVAIASLGARVRDRVRYTEQTFEVPLSKWPSPGQSLPVVFDRDHTDRMRVEWDQILSSNDRARQDADQSAATPTITAAPAIHSRP